MATAERKNNFDNFKVSKIQSSTHALPTSALTRRGTGPRTRLGKERSKHNALKHGILCKIVVLKGESQADFDSLLRGLCDDFQAVGPFEEGLVETLAVTRWRQRRLLIAEAAEIQAGMESIEWDEKERRRVEASRIEQVHYKGGLVREIANPEALQRCLALLEELKDAIERNDFDQESDEPTLTTLCGNCEDAHWQRTLFDSYVLWSKGQLVPEQGEFSLRERKRNFLAELADEQRRLERYQKERTSIESNRMKLEALRRNVPDSPRLDSLLRYAASLETHLRSYSEPARTSSAHPPWPAGTAPNQRECF